MTEVEIVNAHMGEGLFKSLGKQKGSSNSRFTVIDTRNFKKIPELIGRRISEKTVKSIKNSYKKYINQIIPELESLIEIQEDKELNESKEKLQKIIEGKIKTSITYGGNVIKELNSEIEKIDARLAKLAQDSLNKMYTEQEIVNFINYWLQHVSYKEFLKDGQQPKSDACNQITDKYKYKFYKYINDNIFEKYNIVYDASYSKRQHDIWENLANKEKRLPKTGIEYGNSLINLTLLCSRMEFDDNFPFIQKNWKAIYHEQVSIWLAKNDDYFYAKNLHQTVTSHIRTYKEMIQYQKGKTNHAN